MLVFPHMARSVYFALVVAGVLLINTAAAAPPKYLLFESGPVQPVALTPDGLKLLVTNIPDNRLEVFDVAPITGELTHTASVPVGLEPVSVAATATDVAWVVNHLSDSVSIVALSGTPRVTRTLHVGDEPRGIAVAGENGERVFVATAHRGQNSPNGGRHNRIPGNEDAPDASAWDTPGTGRHDVWSFDATNPGSELGGTPLSVITVFGDKPRALIASADGTSVYSAVFRSGNQTTSINRTLVCPTSQNNFDTDTVEPACTLPSGQVSPGGYPPPHQNHEGEDRPEVGVIVKLNRDGSSPNQWQDELGRDWSDVVKFDLPDRDVFEIDAAAPVPVAVDGSATCSNGFGCWASVGTSLFNMVPHPTNGKIYVSNTEAQNHVRFEGNGTYADGKKPPGEPNTVQGNLAQTRITVLDGTSVEPRHLNKHIDYSLRPVPANTADASLSTPLDMVIDVKEPADPNDDLLYLAAFGSQKIGVFNIGELEADTFTPNSASHIELSGGGPAGLALGNGFLYVFTRFDHAIAVLDTNNGNIEIQKLMLHDVEDTSITGGRDLLYDARETSENGEPSCGVCHLFGDNDDMAWDLGNPDDDVVPNTNPFHDPPGPFSLPLTFHPTKGNMTTQTLRGLRNMGPQHWRGDRQGDETAAFKAFNVAFPGLLGRDAELTDAQMSAFTDFALQITSPPNPIQKLDGSLRPQEDLGMQLFTATGVHAGRITDTVETCVGCHETNRGNGHFGGNGESTFDGGTQHFKVPHLRNIYQKIGMFGMASPIPGALGGAFEGDPDPFGNKGPQIRGFGFNHEGGVDTVFRFLSSTVFSLTDSEQTELTAAMVSFPTDLAAIVGQQVTLTPASSSNPAVTGRVDLLEARAAAPFVSNILGGTVTECDLVAHLVEGAVARGYLFSPSTGSYTPDDGGGLHTSASLRTLAGTSGQELTYTCAPPGSGNRMALDRDDDRLWNGFETGDGVFHSPTETGTNPAKKDTDGDGFDDGVEVFDLNSDPNDPNDPGTPLVPALTAESLAALAGLLAAAGAFFSRARRRPRAS